MADDKLEIEYAHEEMLDLEDEVGKGIKELDKGRLSSSERSQKWEYVDDRLKRLKVIALRATSGSYDHYDSESAAAH
jgi:hypothetical protein